MANNEFTVNGIDVRFKKINKDDYISLTDLARYANPSEPKVPIATWMRNKDVISYLGLWERLHNPDFKGHEFETFESAAGRHSFYLSPQKWIESTNAIGIVSKSGNNGGTYAHHLVGGNGDAYTRGAHQHPQIGITAGHVLRHL